MNQTSLTSIALIIETFVLILQIFQLMHLRFNTKKIKQIDKVLQNDKLLNEIFNSNFWDKK